MKSAQFINSHPETLIYWVPSMVSLTSWVEGASLALVGHLSGDGIMMKMVS